jgi:hypothetical protein
MKTKTPKKHRIADQLWMAPKAGKTVCTLIAGPAYFSPKETEVSWEEASKIAPELAGHILACMFSQKASFKVLPE